MVIVIVPHGTGSPGDLRLGVGAVGGGARPRAAPAMQTPPSPPHHHHNRIMGGVSEPELHTNSGKHYYHIYYQYFVKSPLLISQ